jgi:hypothetical protein
MVIGCIIVGVLRLQGQSTYGTIADASVKITNVDENTVREVKANRNGDYNAPNLLPAHYKIDITSSGFQNFNATDLSLIARQTLRVDATLQVGTTQQTVSVNDSEAGAIATDRQESQASFDRRALLNLPANIRANGNTSPYQLIQILPGVQADKSGIFSIQGGIQSQTRIRSTGSRLVTSRTINL